MQRLTERFRRNIEIKSDCIENDSGEVAVSLSVP